MTRTIITILLFSGLTTLIWADEVIADEVYLCVSKENQYVVLTDGKGSCIEEESEIMISSSSIKAGERNAPLANFQENEGCEGEGSKVDVGFDTNQSGVLEPEEILNSSSSCLKIAEPSVE
ncbi:MAG: hypothetical protein DHS20C13_02420 [Thermodesulfobacteriota bacterium]|nr:MAG: hypothetical protein DHS20C13_02420 [Thermodesulfobacteriota bacterium]